MVELRIEICKWIKGSIPTEGVGGDHSVINDAQEIMFNVHFAKIKKPCKDKIKLTRTRSSFS